MSALEPCTCPASLIDGPHPARAHEQDCGGDGGCTGCWGCTAETVAYHQVLGLRGAA